MKDPYANFVATTFHNGLRVYASELPDVGWEAVACIVYAGAADDPKGKKGLAHFTEHLVSKNIPGVPYDNAREFFSQQGGSVSFGRTGYSCTVYEFFSSTDPALFQKALTIFGSMLFGSSLSEFIDRERRVIQGEYNKNFPVQLPFDRLRWRREALFSGHPSLDGFTDSLGTLDSIAAIDKGDVQAFYDTYYVPANVAVVAIGGLSCAQVFRALAREIGFSRSESGVSNHTRKRSWNIPTPSVSSREIRLGDYITTPINSGEYLTGVALPLDLNYDALRLLSKMIYQILFEEFRQKRSWVYEVKMSMVFFRDVRECTIGFMGLRSEVIGKTDELVDECIAQVADASDLFMKVYQTAIAELYMRDQSGRGIRDGAVDDLVEFNKIYTREEDVWGRRAVTFNDVKKLLPLLQRSRRWTFLAHP